MIYYYRTEESRENKINKESSIQMDECDRINNSLKLKHARKKIELNSTIRTFVGQIKREMERKTSTLHTLKNYLMNKNGKISKNLNLKYEKQNKTKEVIVKYIYLK